MKKHNNLWLIFVKDHKTEKAVPIKAMPKEQFLSLTDENGMMFDNEFLAEEMVCSADLKNDGTEHLTVVDLDSNKILLDTTNYDDCTKLYNSLGKSKEVSSPFNNVTLVLDQKNF